MSHFTLLPWLWAAMFAALIAHALSTGTIRGRRQPLFTRKNEPLDYWIAVGVVTSFAAGMASVAVLQ